MTTPTNSSFQTIYRELLLEFLAELLTATYTSETSDAFQRAVQTFCNELGPWFAPEDAPTDLRTMFSLFDNCTINEETDLATVQLSLQGRRAFSLGCAAALS